MSDSDLKSRRPWIAFALVFSLLLCIFFHTRGHAKTLDADAPSGHCITRFNNGWVNWSTGSVFGVGRALPKDNENRPGGEVAGAARADANRNVIEILKRIKIIHSLTVEDYAAGSDVVLAGIEKTARDAAVVRQYYTSALGVDMIIETSIFGGFLQLVLPDDIRQIHQIRIENRLNRMDIRQDPPCTGLIVDVRGLNFEPVLNLLIISEQGQEVYSPVFISREFAVQNGVCKYVCSMDQAMEEKRLGAHPVIISGLRKDGQKNSAIVISMADYRFLEKKSERHQFLKECRVVVVKD